VKAKISSSDGGQNAALTTELVRAAQYIEPEFVDCDGLRQGFGIKRSLAYSLLQSGAIKGVSVRRKGALRGKRLFSVDSVRAFLREQMEGDNETT
jgi:hypothetical protein